MDRENVRLRGQEPTPLNDYDMILRAREAFLERGFKGKIVIDGNSREPKLTRQGHLCHLANPCNPEHGDLALGDWMVLWHDVRKQSGKHTHQGGLVIYVLEGKGWSVCDGVRWDWEEGDLLLLPIQKGGIEHQHFNAQPGTSCRWLAFVHMPSWDAVASELTQNETYQEWQQTHA